MPNCTRVVELLGQAPVWVNNVKLYVRKCEILRNRRSLKQRSFRVVPKSLLHPSFRGDLCKIGSTI